MDQRVLAYLHDTEAPISSEATALALNCNHSVLLNDVHGHICFSAGGYTYHRVLKWCGRLQPSSCRPDSSTWKVLRSWGRLK